MNHYVYKITNLINNKKYIGKRSCKCPIEIDEYMGSGVLMKKALKKYGVDNFSKTILKICDNEEEAFKWESFYIESAKAYDRDDYYNIAAGGKGGFTVFAGKSEEELLLWRKRMSESRKGRIITDEWKAKIIKSRKEKGIGVGENNPMYGKKGIQNHASKPIVMINFEGDLIKKFECIVSANEFLNKNKANSLISRICRSKNGTAYNYLWLFETDYIDMNKNNTYDQWILNMRNRYLKRTITNNLPDNSKSVFQLNKDTLEIINSFNSISEASNVTKINSSLISRTCRHGSNSAGGFSWIFQNEYHNLNKQELKALYEHKYKPVPIESREKQRIAVYCLTTNQKFDSVKDAITFFNLCKGTKISAACKGKRKTAGKHPITKEGLKWMYYDDYVNSSK